MEPSDMDKLRLEMAEMKADFEQKIRALQETKQEEQTALYGGAPGAFIARGKTGLTAKAVLTKMYFARTDEDIRYHKSLINTPLYDIRDGRLYIYTETGSTWLVIEDAMKDEAYSSAFIYDAANGTLYFNDAGNLQELITTTVTTNSVTVPAGGSFRFPLARPLTRDVRVLVKDNRDPQRGPLMVAGEGICTVAYDAEGVDIFNETKAAVDVQVSYRAELGAEYFVNNRA